MNILLWLIVGLISGFVASVIMGTNRQQGVLMDIVMGVIGAFLGGLLMSLFGQPGVTGFNLYSIIVATAGAVVAIWASRQFNYRT